MKDTATEAARDWLALLFAGLGVSAIPYHQYLGGMFLAVAAASLIARHRKDPRKLWFVMSASALLAHVTAMAWPHFNLEIPAQIGMVAVGASSSWLLNVIVKMGDRVESQADVIADKVIDRVLPDKEDDK